jgi:hypothetical protein
MSNKPETREEMIGRLRQRLKREPTEADIRLALRYYDMAHQLAQFRDESEGE